MMLVGSPALNEEVQGIHLDMLIQKRADGRHERDDFGKKTKGKGELRWCG